MADGPCRRAVRERILTDMLGAATAADAAAAAQAPPDPGSGGATAPASRSWKVLVLDEFTTRITSSVLRMSEILDAGVSVVEDLSKSREPLPLPAVYFISPTPAAVSRLVADFSGRGPPPYPAAHVFFSGRVTPEVIEKIKRCSQLVPLLRSLKELNLELLVVDGRTVVTDHPQALVRLMGARCETSGRAEAEAELDAITARLATLFAALGELPSIRYRVGRAPEVGDLPGAAARSVLTQRLATRLSERLTALQRACVLPNRETADLVVLDRSLDPVAPIIHEWTYESMVYDLLPVDGPMVRYEVSGSSAPKEHLLEEGNDELWAQLRHSHIADVYTTLAKRFSDFQSRNRAAQFSQKAGGAEGGLSSGNIRQLIQALPQFRDVLGRLSVHIYLSTEVKAATNSRQLTDVGELEQELVYGDKGTQDLIKWLADRASSLDPRDRLRLFLCYAATHPDKLDSTKAAQWQKLARLESTDMAAAKNLGYIGVRSHAAAAAAQSKGLTFGFTRKKSKSKTTYRKREGREEGTYALSRFDPVLLDVVEDTIAGKLATDEYPHVRPPEPDAADDFGTADFSRISSARTNRSGLNWARRANSNEPGSAGSGVFAGAGAGAAAAGAVATGGAAGGRRLFVFVIGGVTRSEMRVVHALARSSGRDVVLASTNLLRPGAFIQQLVQLGDD